jgi:glyoxylase-like metal-dependent hydrolase (beta-lactamase superfamily II)
VFVLAAHNASDWTGPSGNNTYLLPGACASLVDAGVGHTAHVSSIERALNGSPLESVLITHGHPDHMAGVPMLIERWPDLRVSKMRPNLPDGAEPLSDGDRVDAGNGTLVVVATPGHSPDHSCFFDEQTGDLYCGDLVRIGGTIVISPAQGGDLGEYLRSLQRVRALGPKRLLPGHGPIVEDPGQIIASYLQHRAEREAQVINGLRTGASGPEQLVAAIYPALGHSLVPAAAEMMRAHLAKLLKEGRVRHEDGRWSLTSR